MGKPARVGVIGSSFDLLQLADEHTATVFEEIDDPCDSFVLGLTHNTITIIGWTEYDPS